MTNPCLIDLDRLRRPTRQHHCAVGWEQVPITADERTDPYAPAFYRDPTVTHWLRMRPNEPEGTVRRCDECGRTWVSRRRRYQPGSGQYRMDNEWLPESRFARWRRERRTPAHRRRQ